MKNKRTPAGDAFAGFAITVLQLAGHLTTAGDILAKPAGQTSARWQILAAAENRDLSVAQIARLLGVSRQGVQRIADILEADGLIRYKRNPAHQRAKLVTLTTEGLAVLVEIQERQCIWANKLGAEIEKQDLQQATQVLFRVLEKLKVNSGQE